MGPLVSPNGRVSPVALSNSNHAARSEFGRRAVAAEGGRSDPDAMYHEAYALICEGTPIRRVSVRVGG